MKDLLPSPVKIYQMIKCGLRPTFKKSTIKIIITVDFLFCLSELK